MVGPEFSGRIASPHAVLAAAKRDGGVAAPMDAEGTADAESLLAGGGDLDALIPARPASATDAPLLLTILADRHGLDALALATLLALCNQPADRLQVGIEALSS